MRVYMIRNAESGEWFISKKNSISWTYKQHHGFVTNSKRVIYEKMRAAKVYTDAELKVIEFEAKELE